MKKISIVMAYWDNRKTQLINTLDNFQSSYAGKYNFEVVIVDDGSSKDFRLHNIITNYSFPIKYIIISVKEKGDRINPCSAYNRGFKEADGNIIIIQNPECYHVGDLLGKVLENISSKKYISFSCFSANSQIISDELISLKDSKKISEKIENNSFLKTNGKLGINWYNHPTINNKPYHFCTAIYKSNIENMGGGFDINFADGFCFDDDEFLLTIEHHLKLKIVSLTPDNGFVIHQWHIRPNNLDIYKASKDHPLKQKWLRNQKLFEEKKKRFGL